MKRYIVQPGHTFNYRYFDGARVSPAFASEGDAVETEDNQVYVVSNGIRVHTTEYGWMISKNVTAGTLGEE